MDEEPDAEAVAERVLAAALGMMDVVSIYLGDRLGWYRSLMDEGPATPTELATRTGTSERYAREWLQQQAATGLLATHIVGEMTRFRLPPGAAEVFTNVNSLNYLSPLARMLAGAAVQLPALQDAYKAGTGVGWEDFGKDVREAQADMNRPWFEQELGKALSQVPALVARLQEPGVEIADIGSGGGWSTIALAEVFPTAKVTGFDIDSASVELARMNATNAGSAIEFKHLDAAGLPVETFDAVFAFECLHDMPYPQDVLSGVRRSLKQGGTAVIIDEAVAETFDPPGTEVERLMYGFSLLICLPDGMSHLDSAATGTVMRPDTLRRYASAAGFTEFSILPIQNFGFFRFYELAPSSQ